MLAVLHIIAGERNSFWKSHWRKTDCKSYLRCMIFLPYKDDMLKKDTVDIINNEKLEVWCRTDKFAKENRHTVLWLLLYYFELNSVELVWAQVKNLVSFTKIWSKISRKLIKDLVEWFWIIGIIMCNTKKIEEEMCKAEEILDDIEPIIIQLHDSSSDENSSDRIDRHDIHSLL